MRDHYRMMNSNGTQIATAGRLVATVAAALLALASAKNVAAQSLADRLKDVQSGKRPADLTKSNLPAWKPIGSSGSSLEIPLTQNLVVVTAVNDPLGDYESIKTVQKLTAATVMLGYSADKPTPRGVGGNANTNRVSGVRVIDVPDLANSHAYSEVFSTAQEHFPGTTAISTSAEVLTQLRAGQQVDFQFVGGGMADLFGLGALLGGGKGGMTKNKNGQSMYLCKLHRVEPTDLAAPVLVNNVRVELPALHAKCVINDDDEVNFYFLDQPSNPVTLAFQLGTGSGGLQAIKISFPKAEQPKTAGGGGGTGGGGGAGAGGGGGGDIEQTLANKKPVEIYGIYFDFNSSTIKPESQAVLQQISDIMQKNPSWKVSIAGHTDNIGDNSFNEGLSERRAAAVKDALVAQYKIGADRLTTSGFGASRPIETNATMEGRARNRRVELQRQ